MKYLKVKKSSAHIEEFRLGERAQSPNEFVKDIIYRDGNYTVTFSDDGEWFKTFTGYQCEYLEFSESKTKSNRTKLQ